MIAIENIIRINQTLIEKFSADLDLIFSTGLCLKNFHHDQDPDRKPDPNQLNPD